MLIPLNEIPPLFLEVPKLEVRSIVLVGSRLQAEHVDFWSDTDLLLCVSPASEIQADHFLAALSKLGEPIAKELYLSPDKLSLRIIISTDTGIQKLDISVFHSTIKSPTLAFQLLWGELPTFEPHSDTTKKISQKADQIWFLFYECVKKFMRSDHLIGLHLLLELIREYLVFQMINRDQERGTHIHRFGYQEQLPREIELAQINYHHKPSLLNYLEKLAEFMDLEMEKQLQSYSSKLHFYKRYLENGRKYLNEG
ncbi:MAG: hypothetical protein MRZ79_12225 [Bacteroidia bacterium]|nr:hypothetical protein [Bacteroidia bacterium]